MTRTENTFSPTFKLPCSIITREQSNCLGKEGAKKRKKEEGKFKEKKVRNPPIRPHIPPTLPTSMSTLPPIAFPSERGGAAGPSSLSCSTLTLIWPGLTYRRGCYPLELTKSLIPQVINHNPLYITLKSLTYSV